MKKAYGTLLILVLVIILVTCSKKEDLVLDNTSSGNLEKNVDVEYDLKKFAEIAGTEELEEISMEKLVEDAYAERINTEYVIVHGEVTNIECLKKGSMRKISSVLRYYKSDEEADNMSTEEAIKFGENINYYDIYIDDVFFH